MPYITVGTEKDFAAIAVRVLTARASKSAHAGAVAALAAANPGVDGEALAPGTILRIPPLAAARVKVEGVHPGSLADLVDRVRGELDGLSRAISVQGAADADRRKQYSRRLASADLRRLASSDAIVRKRLAEVAKSAKADAKAALGETARWQAALDALSKDMDTLPTERQ